MNKFLLILLFIAGLLMVFYGFDNKFFLLKLKNTQTTIIPDKSIKSLSFAIPIKEKIASVSEKYNPCKQTIYYSFGQLDSKHNISPEKLREIMKKVESVWEKPTGLNLFEYKEGTSFKINFIFDERQEQTNLFSDLNKKLTILEKSHNNISGEYKELLKKYNHSLKKYLKRKKEFEQGVKKYKKEVSFWNKNGNITEDKYKNLQEKRDSFLKQQQDLENKIKKLNKLANKLNSLSRSDKTLVEQYNTSINTYKNKYGSSTEFSQGEFFGTGINIYEFNDSSDLELVLAHEFGHALGLKHVNNPTSIMYYLIGKQDLNNLHLTAEDLTAFYGLCRLIKY